MPRRVAGTLRGVDNPTAAQPPTWMNDIVPGLLDRRVLDQTTFWVTVEASVLEIGSMSSEHLIAVLLMLGDSAPQFRMLALADLVYDDEPGLALELGLLELTGSCMATVSPWDWLAATPFVRALFRELHRRSEG